MSGPHLLRHFWADREQLIKGTYSIEFFPVIIYLQFVCVRLRVGTLLARRYHTNNEKHVCHGFLAPLPYLSSTSLKSITDKGLVITVTVNVTMPLPLI